jgi:N utilization substance protein A
MSKTAMQEKHNTEASTQIELFVAHLEVDEELAEVLVNEGFTSLEEVAYVPTAEMLDIDGFDEDLVNELKQRAKDALLTLAIVNEEKTALAEPADDLLALEGMTVDLAKTLAGQGIVTQEDLAELGTDELLELVSLPEQAAAELIMKARAPWFE